MAPRSEEGVVLANSTLANWYRLVSDAMERTYRSLAYKTDTRAVLGSCGFVDIQEQIIHIPLNTWPKDWKEKEIGRWFNVAFGRGLEAMSLAPLSRIYHWTQEEVADLCSKVQNEMKSRQFRAYCRMLVPSCPLRIHPPT